MRTAYMKYDDSHTAKFHSPGRCIYCGSDGGIAGLRDEHIIQYSLGGRTILPNASCAKCEGVTHALEGHFAYHYFDDIRWQQGFPSRRPKKDRPTTLPALIGKDEIEVDLSFEDHPSMGFVLELPNPGIFRGVEPSDVFPQVTLSAFVAVPDLKDRMARLPDGAATWRGEVPIGPFVRSLAKIAQALAVGERGIDGFVPYLREYILTGEGPGAYYIGGTWGEPPLVAEPLLHRLGTELLNHNGKELVVARIRLFAYAGAPLYTVVVGETAL
jgi:hypothetical protein